MAFIHVILLLGLTYQCRALGAQEHRGNLTEACFDNSTCIDTNNTICEASKCLTKYGKPCQNTTECVSNAECNTTFPSNTCNCKQGFTNQTLGTCGLTFNASCGASNATFCGTGLICNADKCVRKLGETCTQSNECVQNAECNTTCKCISGHVQQSDFCYVRATADITVDTACTYGTDTCETGALCDRTLNKCVYKSGVTCATAAGKCVTGATCATIADSCVCTLSGYVARTDGYCGLISGKTCTSTTPCVDNADCASSGKCECKSGYTAKTDGTCSAGAVGLVGSFVLLMAAVFTATHLR